MDLRGRSGQGVIMRALSIIFLGTAAIMLAVTGCRHPGGGGWEGEAGRQGPVSDSAVTGVYGTPEQLTPTEMRISQDIAQLLQGGLPEELRSASNSVRALVSQGVVTLQGTVPTDDLSRELENRISIMPGVQRVINQLVVELK
jgi:hypothetical protein